MNRSQRYFRLSLRDSDLQAYDMARRQPPK